MNNNKKADKTNNDQQKQKQINEDKDKASNCGNDENQKEEKLRASKQANIDTNKKTQPAAQR